MSAAVATVPLSAAPSAAPAPAPAPTRNPYTRKRTVLGDPAPLACTVAKTALEVVQGAPGVDGLARWVAPEIRNALAQQHSLARRAGRRPQEPVRIIRVRVCRVSATAAEVTVVAHHDERAHPIAMRLEDTAGKWLTTVLEVG